MLRLLIGSAFRVVSNVNGTALHSLIGAPLQKAAYSSLQLHGMCKPLQFYSPLTKNTGTGLLQHSLVNGGLLLQTARDVTKFSLNKGKRKTVRAVLKRFKRLDWGCWIRTHTGRHKKLFKKSSALKRRLRQHIFTNSTQSWLLDKMVCSYWRRPKNWIDDPYEPYNQRNEFFATKSKTFKV